MSEQETKLWHMRLEHLSEQGMKMLSKKGVFGGKKLRVLLFSKYCVYGKHKRVSFKLVIDNTKGVLVYVHSLGSFKKGFFGWMLSSYIQ